MQNCKVQNVNLFPNIWLTLLLSKNTKTCPCVRVSNFPLKCRKQTWSYHKVTLRLGRTTKKVWVCTRELESC